MSDEQKSSSRTVGLQRRIVVLILLVISFMGLLIFSSYRLGSRMLEVYTPLVDAVMEIQLNATTAHLWFEELMSDDTNEDIQSVYAHLDLANRYALLMLKGGKFGAIQYEPLTDGLLRKRVESVRGQLRQFRKIMDKRWHMRESSRPGSAIDQRFDIVYNKLIDNTNSLESELEAMTEKAMQRFFINHLVLMLFAIIVTVSVGWLVHRFLLRQAYHLHLLEQVNGELALEVERRKLTEAELEHQATTDPLTGILNRGRMSELLQDEWSRAVRYNEPFAIVMFDIDHFKQVNDRLGHPAGDRVLVELTQRVNEELRENDVFARWGGEEFLLLLPNTDLHGAEEVAERCREAFATTPVDDIGTVTASFGVVAYHGKDDTLEQLLQRADTALYSAKREGRDRVSSTLQESDA